MVKKQDLIVIFGLSLLLIGLSLWSLSVGDVEISFSKLWTILQGGVVDNSAWSYIVENRINRTIMAVLAGSSLAVTGLILQVFFRNPLAGPGVLGISSGVTLGVAFVVLGGVSLTFFGVNLSLIISGLLGALLILFILMYVSKFIKQSVTLLIVGLMLSYFTSAFVSTLYHWANLEQSRQFIVWGLGSFEGVSTTNLKWIVPVVILFMSSLIVLIKPLNALVLGEEYAKSIGVNIKSTKLKIIVTSSVLTAIITVYCGPIAFIGIAVPQIVRSFTKSKSHLIILPMAILMGALFAITADLLIRFSGNILPLNTITSLIGAPIIIWSIIQLNKKG